MELAYSGLHQLCAPMLDRLEATPAPQRDALATVFGQTTRDVNLVLSADARDLDSVPPARGR